MARAAVLGRLSWQQGTVSEIRKETAAATSIAIDLPDWSGHLPGQHVDVRLTAADGYSAERSYSIASAPERGRVELTVQRLPDGEVSPYLTETLQPGYPFELRGPIGGWFVWDPASPGPVLLVAGGSGVVPLMSMIRSRAAADSHAPFQLLYSVRGPADALYAAELAERQRQATGLRIDYVYTRAVPDGWPHPPGRLTAAMLPRADDHEPPAVFVCGPTGFVEAVANLLIQVGHQPGVIKTERFGPSGG
ncbi:MAG TPA: ferredoxin reductase [Streptosporangiaceae bacterium]|jgi:ferredoxin-NADP reductase